jgi:hypothetical protein
MDEGYITIDTNWEGDSTGCEVWGVSIQTDS